MNKVSELTINELDSYLNVTQKLIDKLLVENKTNANVNKMMLVQKRLDKLNKCRNIIIKEIDRRLDEISF